MLMLLSHVIFQFSNGSVKDLSPPESLQRTTLGCQAPLVLWAGIDQEESKKQVGLLQLGAHCFVSVSGVKCTEAR